MIAAIREFYEEPVLEVVEFDVDDIITTSGEEEDPDWGMGEV